MSEVLICGIAVVLAVVLAVDLIYEIKVRHQWRGPPEDEPK